LASDAIGPARLLRGAEIKVCDGIFACFSALAFSLKGHEQQKMGGALEKAHHF
jgi:hypothetical protein